MRARNTGLKPSRRDASHPKGDLPKVGTKADVSSQGHSPSPYRRTGLLCGAGPGISPCWAPRPPGGQHSHHVPQPLVPCRPQAGLGDGQVSRGRRCWKHPRGTCWGPSPSRTSRRRASLLCPTHAPLEPPQLGQVLGHLAAPECSPHLF